MSKLKKIGIEWASWASWTPPDNKCESHRQRTCENCLADKTCVPVKSSERTCKGHHKETQYNINKPGCSKF